MIGTFLYLIYCLLDIINILSIDLAIVIDFEDLVNFVYSAANSRSIIRHRDRLLL